MKISIAEMRKTVAGVYHTQLCLSAGSTTRITLDCGKFCISNLELRFYQFRSLIKNGKQFPATKTIQPLETQIVAYKAETNEIIFDVTNDLKQNILTRLFIHVFDSISMLNTNNLVPAYQPNDQLAEYVLKDSIQQNGDTTTFTKVIVLDKHCLEQESITRSNQDFNNFVMKERCSNE